MRNDERRAPVAIGEEREKAGADDGEQQDGDDRGSRAAGRAPRTSRRVRRQC